LVWIRIQIRRSKPLTYGFGSNLDPDPALLDPALFVSDVQDAKIIGIANKTIFFPSYLLFEGTFTLFLKDKK
jgi:hypothetical protein